jgi:hypothetical protein
MTPDSSMSFVEVLILGVFGVQLALFWSQSSIKERLSAIEKSVELLKTNDLHSLEEKTDNLREEFNKLRTWVLERQG